jgi:hypothetical protein
VKRLLLACSLVVALSSQAWAQFTAMMLHNICASDDERENTGCDMWIGGFEAGLFAAQAASPKDRRITCLPNGFTGGQAKLIVIKFLKDHPNILHEPADVVAFVAISQAFPCPKSSN